MTDTVYVVSGAPDPNTLNPVNPTIQDAITAAQTFSRTAGEAADLASDKAEVAVAAAAAAGNHLDAVQSGLETLAAGLSEVNTLAGDVRTDRQAVESAAGSIETYYLGSKQAATDAQNAASQAQQLADDVHAAAILIEGGPVSSVNGRTGAITLDASDISTTIANLDSLVGQANHVIGFTGPDTVELVGIGTSPGDLPRIGNDGKLGVIDGSNLTNVNAFQPGDMFQSARVMPAGYLKCNGAVYAKTAYPALAAAIGPRFNGFGAASLGNVGAAATLRDVIFANGQFVAVGDLSGSAVAYTSPDGASWTAQTIPSPSSNALQRVWYINCLYVAQSSTSTALRYSSDGITWSATTTGPNVAANVFLYGAGKYVAAGGAGAIRYKSTAIDVGGFSTATSALTGNVSSGVYAFGLFIVADQAGNIVTSSDGSTWTQRVSSAVSISWMLQVGGTVYAAASGAVGAGVIKTSDGITWTLAASSHPGGNQAFHDGYNFYAFGGGGAMNMSNAPEEYWLPLQNITTPNGGAFDGTSFVTVYASGAVRRQTRLFNPATHFAVPTIQTTTLPYYVRAA